MKKNRKKLKIDLETYIKNKELKKRSDNMKSKTLKTQVKDQEVEENNSYEKTDALLIFLLSIFCLPVIYLLPNVANRNKRKKDK